MLFDFRHFILQNMVRESEYFQVYFELHETYFDIGLQTLDKVINEEDNQLISEHSRLR